MTRYFHVLSTPDCTIRTECKSLEQAERLAEVNQMPDCYSWAEVLYGDAPVDVPNFPNFVNFAI